MSRPILSADEAPLRELEAITMPLQPLTIYTRCGHRAPTPAQLASWFATHAARPSRSREIAKSMGKPIASVQRALVAFARNGHVALRADSEIGEGWTWVDRETPRQVLARYERRDLIAAKTARE